MFRSNMLDAYCFNRRHGIGIEDAYVETVKHTRRSGGSQLVSLIEQRRHKKVNPDCVVGAGCHSSAALVAVTQLWRSGRAWWERRGKQQRHSQIFTRKR